MIPNTHLWIGVNPVIIPDREIDGKRYRAAEYDHEYRGHWDPTGDFNYRRGLYDVEEGHTLSFSPMLGIILASEDLRRWKPLRDYFLVGIEQVLYCRDSLGLITDINDLCEEVINHFSSPDVKDKLNTLFDNPNDITSIYIESTVINPLRKLQEIIIPGRDYMLASHPRRVQG